MNIVFYGGGNIAQAFIEGLLRSGYEKNKIFYVDRNPRNKKILKKLQIRSLDNQKSLKVDLFFLAVKPKDTISAYKEILREHKNPKIVSFVAGIRTNRYKKINKNIEFLRAMPNTSSKFNLSITGIYNSSFNKTNLAKAVRIIKRVGMTILLNKESK
jgi:Pyrroline-5-carboxylate reductase